MTEQVQRRYPIGIQTFEEIRKGGYLYFDKTGYACLLARKYKYAFLTRPRRFGKSLLVSTLQAYFEGKRELFDGLEADRMQTAWTAHPVLKFSFAQGNYYKEEILKEVIDSQLGTYEKQYGVAPTNVASFGIRLKNIVEAARRQTGHRAVVLVDEYDSPMLRSHDTPRLQSALRDIMRDFYSPLKDLDPSLRFVLLTGITKFSQLSIFSELNNLNNITFEEDFSAICGVTEEEMLSQCRSDIEVMARHLELSYEEMTRRLRFCYDGYHFTPAGPGLYNPFSLITAFAKRDIYYAWYSSGTPTFLVELMNKRQMEMTDLEGVETEMEVFDQSTETISDPIPVLYQSGYLTIKAYDRRRQTFTLGFPNEEVRRGFASSLLQFVAPDFSGGRLTFRSAWLDFCENRQLEDFIEAIRVFFATIPYDLHGKQEKSYQSLLYTALAAVGADVLSEVRTSEGRIDIVLRTPQDVVLFELKLDRPAAEALQQVADKHYDLPFMHDGRSVRRVGLSFSSKTRTVEDFKLL